MAGWSYVLPVIAGTAIGLGSHLLGGLGWVVALVVIAAAIVALAQQTLP